MYVSLQFMLVLLISFAISEYRSYNELRKIAKKLFAKYENYTAVHLYTSFNDHRYQSCYHIL